MKFLLDWLFKSHASQRAAFENILVAKVTGIEKHPNADRLRLITLFDGTKTIEPVVCGAWNFEVGAIVPLALPGAVISHNQHDPAGKPFTLGKATIRGVESQGMICSGKELGLSEEGAGIIIIENGEQYIGQTFNSSYVRNRN